MGVSTLNLCIVQGTFSVKVGHFLLGVFTLLLCSIYNILFALKMFFLLFLAFLATLACHHTQISSCPPSRPPLWNTPLQSSSHTPTIIVITTTLTERKLSSLFSLFEILISDCSNTLYQAFGFGLAVVLLSAYLFVLVWALALQLDPAAVFLVFIYLPLPSSHTQSISSSQRFSAAGNTSQGGEEQRWG